MKRLIILLLIVFWSVYPAAAQSDVTDLTDHRQTMLDLLDTIVEAGADNYVNGINMINAIGARGDALYIAPLIDLGFFTRASSLRSINDAIYDALENLSGESFENGWVDYFVWASEENVALPPGYDEYKGKLFGTILDPRFERFFADVQETAQVNLLEVVWGGVRVDGIPSLVNAPQVTPEEAAAEGQELVQFCRDGDCSYPAADEYVFGVYLDGNARAYPLRQLNWHEMFNDVIGSAPLYDAPDGEVLCNFLAPVNFRAVGRMGDAWVLINGDSAGCPENEGWLQHPTGLNWYESDWVTVRESLPDVTGADPLSSFDGVLGQVPGKPIMLAYCTLCGSGVLYDPVIDELVVDGESQGETVLEFGSTGMLMRSNKLMYDRTTYTIWNALTGEPAFGPLAGSGVQLERLPVVVTDWATWLEEHPDTTVLSLNTGITRSYINGAAYSQYFNDPNFIMFPVWQQDESVNENKEIVFTLLLDDTPKAYPLRLLIPESVTNDTLAGVDLVIVSRDTPQRDFFEPGGASVRAYERGEYTFSPGETHREVIDQDGTVWQVTEDALVSPDGETLPRLPEHLAFWFGWYGFYPDTLVYEGM